MGEIVELAGCDLLTISPALLDELHNTQGELVRKLHPAISSQSDVVKIPMDKATFEAMHSSDQMASEKLDEGIKGFSKALITLEELLAERLAKLEEPVLATV